jgi:tetratricopeptide (TPR) repeat protein
MIELMLEAERAMGIGLLDNAERMYRQVVAVDPRNSIAWTGLARVALEREDQLAAYLFARRAMAIDPENPVASHLARRMAEQFRMRGEETPPDLGLPVESRTVDTPADDAPAETPSPQSEPAQPSLVDRLLRRRR